MAISPAGQQRRRCLQLAQLGGSSFADLTFEFGAHQRMFRRGGAQLG
jgi:hypothetical protein